MGLQLITETLKKAGIAYALLDEKDKNVRILISEKDRRSIITLAGNVGWKRIKDKSGDLYLYGMQRFLYYSAGAVTLTVCCQLACRSTLNDGWVPLDRKINEEALARCRKENDVMRLGKEEELCYLLAKCVYTDKCFEKEDIERIESCFSGTEKTNVLPKLEGIFFRFSERMLEMLEKKEYEDIIGALWRFAEY